MSTSRNRSVVNVVAALPCEARPFIEHFRLRRDSDCVLPMYEGEGPVRLIVSGVGAVPCAMACGLLFGRGGELSHGAWLSVGVAGHKHLAVGEARIVNKVTDAANGRQWYPPLVWDAPWAGEPVTTHHQPQHVYPDHGLVDMEAAGFYSAVSRFTTLELAPCIKVVSDNEFSGCEQVNEAQVTVLIAGQMPAIAALIAQMRQWLEETAAEQVPTEAAERYVARWHFSRSQRESLLQQLRRWHALEPGSSLWSDHLRQCRSARQVLGALAERLSTMGLSASRD